MNQSKDIHQEENDLVSPESLEVRANEILNQYTTDTTNLSGEEFSKKFPLNNDEVKIALPWILNKVFEKRITELKETHSYHLSCDMYSFIEIYRDKGAMRVLFQFDSYIIDDETKKMVLWGVFCVHFLSQDNEDLDYAFHTLIRSYGFDKYMLGEMLGYYFSALSDWSWIKKDPAHWIDKLNQMEEGPMREMLMTVPLLWTEKEFAQYARSSSLPNHVSIGGRNYRMYDMIQKYAKTSKTFTQSGAFKNWCVHLFENSRGRVEFQKVPTKTNDAYGAFYVASVPMPPFIEHIPLGSWKNVESGHEETRYFFKQLEFLSSSNIDVQYFGKMLEDIRSFDAQKSLSEKAQPIVENVSQDVTTLTHRTFINPKQHHTDVAQSLGLDIIDHSDDIGAAEAIGSNYLRYKNQNGESSLHYLPKIAWLIDILEDIIPKNEHEKITAYTLPSSPYIFIYTNTGTVFISDIDNVSTQVFAQKVDAEFINSDFSFPKLGELFGPLTSIKNNFEEIISDEEAESWAENIVDALNKNDGYFLELISEDKNHWLPNLRAMYVSGEITKKDFATPVGFEQFLENYNKQLLIRNDISPKEKQARSFTNSRGNVPITQRFITALGGHKFFTWFHGYSELFSDYLDALLSDNEKQKNDLYEKLRSENRVRTSTKKWIDELGNSTRTISEIQFHQLFSSDAHTKKGMRKELDIPQGLFSCVSWIIALGYDPEQSAEGETPKMCLYRILVEKGILKNKI